MPGSISESLRFANATMKHSNRTKALAGLVCVVLVCLALDACAGGSTAPTSDGGKSGRGKGAGAAAVPVAVANVTRRDVPIDIAVVGNVEAYQTLSVIPIVGGQLTQVYFTEGQDVKKGDKLFTIDPRSLDAALHQQEASLARDQALMAQAQANLARDIASEVNARTEAGRYMSLFEQGIVSKEQGDTYKTAADTLVQSVAADRAAIESASAQILADRAMLENAKVQLSYTTIVSPIDGRTGNLTLKNGNVVTANVTNLVTVTQVQPIYVTFSVPEAVLPDIKRYMALGKLPVFATTQEGGAQTERGELTFIDNNVDMTTGTIKLKGTFENENRKLWPGQYVNVVLRLTTRPHALVLPNQAVQTGQDGTFVYVVREDKTVEARPVTTGPRVDQDFVIDKGLEEGETVVTEGQLRLAPGSHVQFGPGSGRGKNPT